MVRISSARGAIEAPVRISGIRDGVVFVPFHYGYWDRTDEAGPGGAGPTAANELTETVWDPVSKQPLFKVAAVQVSRVRAATGPSPAPTVGGPAPVDGGVPPTIGGPDAAASSTMEA